MSAPGTFVKSASSVYLEYGYETNFGGGVTNPPMLFGKEVKASSLEFKNNQMPLGQLYTPEIESFAYGRNEGKLSVEYVLSNPWFLQSIFGVATSADADGGGSGTVYTHTWSSNPSTDAEIRDLSSMALRIGFNVGAGSADDFVRKPIGAVCNAMTMRMAINETVKITQEILWGNESVSETFATPTGAILAGEAPYTFVHAVITSPLTGSTLATVQTFDLNLNTNAELLYELGGATSKDAWRKILEMTGKVGITVKDSDFLNEVYSRSETSNNLVVTISNGASGNALRNIVMTFSGVSFSTHNTTGIAPGELVLQNVDFQARSASIVAKNQATAVP